MQTTQVSNPFSSGGGGTSFEQRIAALYIVDLLRGNVPYGLNGVVAKGIYFQCRHRGAFIDDLVIVASNANTEAKLYLQVKNRLLFNASNTTFLDTMADAWLTFKSPDSKFVRNVDRIGFAVGRLSNKIKTYFVEGILRHAKETIDPVGFFDDLSTQKVWSNHHRSHLQIVRTAVNNSIDDDVTDKDLWDFLRHLVIIEFDAADPEGKDANRAWNDLRDCLPDRNAQHAYLVFEALVAKAGTIAKTGGSMDADSASLAVQIAVPSLSTSGQFGTDLAIDLVRISSTFVPPIQEVEAKALLRDNNIVILSGPPHIGKSAFALYLANYLRDERKLRHIVKLGPNDDISSLKTYRESVIILDDYFGAVQLNQARTDGYESVIRGRTNNTPIIVTTRSEVKTEAASSSRLCEDTAIDRYTIMLNPEESYDNAGLEAILDKHLSYISEVGVNSEDKISAITHEIVRSQRQYIIGHLRFPHNIERLCSVHLRDVKNDIELFNAVARANGIELATKAWVGRLDDATRWFVFTVTLFPGLPISLIDSIYKLLGLKLQFQTLDAIGLIERCSAYLTGRSQPSVAHPSYSEAILELIHDRYLHRIGELGDIGLEKILNTLPLHLGQYGDADFGWPRFQSFEPVPLRDYATKFIHAYNHLRRTFFPVWPDQHRQLSADKLGIVCLVPQTSRTGFGMVFQDREAMTDDVEIVVHQGTFDDYIPTYRVRTGKPITEFRWSYHSAQQIASRSPFGHACATLRDDIKRMIEKRRLKEPWWIAHARIESALVTLHDHRGASGLDLSPSACISAPDFRRAKDAFYRASGIRTHPIEFSFSNTVRMSELENSFEALAAFGRKYEGHLLPQPDEDRTNYGLAGFSVSRRRELLIAAFDLLLEGYKWIVDTNFPFLKEKLTLYKSLPIKVVGAVAYGGEFRSQHSSFYLFPRQSFTEPINEYQLFIHRDINYSCSELLPFPKEIEQNIIEANCNPGWIKAFHTDPSEFDSPRLLMNRVYAWIDDDIMRAIAWDGVGRYPRWWLDEAKDAELYSLTW